MAKGKNKRKRTKKLAERIAQKKNAEKQQAIKINPFEVHINRQKHQIIGKKEKNDKGLPGVSRGKAERKRKETLLREYKKNHKANVMLDRRIGENDATMSLDAKMAARFTREKQMAEERRMKNKKSIFNLNDEDELTHYGQSLAEIEKFEDPQSEDDEDDERLAKDLLDDGDDMEDFLIKRDGEEEKMSRKDRIEKLIAESKHRKLERQQEKEGVVQLTEKLDDEWKEVRNAIPTKNPSTVNEATGEIDSYDLLVRNLKFEATGKASEKIKTKDEIAEEEKKRLEKLENERLARMRIEESDTKVKRKHISADSLENDYLVPEKDDFKLAYKDGVLVSNISPADEEDDEKDSDGEAANEKNSDDEEAQDKNVEDDETSEEDNEDTDGESAGDDSYCDAFSEDEEEKETKAAEINTKIQTKIETQKKKKKSLKKSNSNSIPDTYEDFEELTVDLSPEEMASLTEKLIKHNDRSLKAENKQKLQRLFNFLLRYSCDVSLCRDDGIETVDKVLPFLFDLVQSFPESSAESFLNVFDEKWKTFRAKSVQCLSRIQSIYPNVDTLILFKLIPFLFPTSDFKHKVVTPAMIFMGQILAECSVNSRREISAGLFICSLFLEFVFLSKRFVPEVMHYLCGLISLAIDADAADARDSCFSPLAAPPFKLNQPRLLLLESSEDAKKISLRPLKLSDLRSSEELTDEFRVNAIFVCCKLVREFADLYKELPSFYEIFAPIQQCYKKFLLSSSSASFYPKEIEKTMEKFDEMLLERHLLTPLMREKKRPQSIKFFEPKIDADFTGQRRKKIGGQSGEKQRLKHLVKRETKGALRELRRDNQFLAKQQLNERMERDAARKRKVKEIYHMLSNQEGDHRLMMKMKRKEKLSLVNQKKKMKKK